MHVHYNLNGAKTVKKLWDGSIRKIVSIGNNLQKEFKHHSSTVQARQNDTPWLFQTKMTPLKAFPYYNDTPVGYSILQWHPCWLFHITMTLLLASNITMTSQLVNIPYFNTTSVGYSILQWYPWWLFHIIMTPLLPIPFYNDTPDGYSILQWHPSWLFHITQWHPCWLFHIHTLFNIHVEINQSELPT